jgi:hypothetical protein
MFLYHYVFIACKPWIFNTFLYGSSLISLSIIALRGQLLYLISKNPDFSYLLTEDSLFQLAFQTLLILATVNSCFRICLSFGKIAYLSNARLTDDSIVLTYGEN